VTNKSDSLGHPLIEGEGRVATIKKEACKGQTEGRDPVRHEWKRPEKIVSHKVLLWAGGG